MKEGFNFRILFTTYNETYLKKYNYVGDQIILSVFTIFSCVVGVVGNGVVIWFLGFRIKRKPLAIYILNLAVADFGSLLFMLPLAIFYNPPTFKYYLYIPPVPYLFLVNLHQLMYTSSCFLLTATSVDRWVSILFPNWYQCHRSRVLSTTVCVLMWVLSFGLNGVPLFLQFSGNEFIPDYYVFRFTDKVSVLICLLLVTISALTLFIKVCFKSQPCQCGNLLKVILLMLPSFLLLTIPSEVWIYTLFTPPAYFVLWISLKSSINPLIYFLAGRQYGGKFQERMKAVLQRVFREERNTKMELQPRAQTML